MKKMRGHEKGVTDNRASKKRLGFPSVFFDAQDEQELHEEQLEEESELPSWELL